MYWLLLLLSVIATAVGLFAIGFGLMPFEGSLGNAYLIAGAVGVVGGMILFALAAAVRDLRRIANALAPRGAGNQAGIAARRQAPLDAADTALPPRPVPATPPPAARIPYPPRPGADQRADQRVDQRETRFERPPGPPTPPQPPVDVPEPPPPRERPRPQVAGPPRMVGEGPMMEEHEEVPIAPSRVAAPPMRAAPPVAEPPSPPEPPRPAEPRPSQADIMARLSNLAATPPRPAPRPEPPRAPPPPPAAERPNERQNERIAAPADPRRANMFDALWPAEVRAARQSQSETIARAPRPPDQRPEQRPDQRSEPRADMRQDSRSEPKIDARPEPRGGPPMPPPMPREPMPREPMPREPALREPAPREPTPREPMSPPPAEPRTIAILKSGVIDGMAYTLYTDGSIEAELPQGTMRFASIDDLRSHLENSDRPA